MKTATKVPVARNFGPGAGYSVLSMFFGSLAHFPESKFLATDILVGQMEECAGAAAALQTPYRHPTGTLQVNALQAPYRYPGFIHAPKAYGVRCNRFKVPVTFYHSKKNTNSPPQAVLLRNFFIAWGLNFCPVYVPPNKET